LPLYAIADGIVQFKDDTNARNSFGKVLIVRYTLSDGTQVDSVYEHMQKILVGAQGTPVYKGLQIATIGDANGYYANAAHLHWEMRRDLSITTTNAETDPYYYPLPIHTALRYTSPSLFVDDRQLAYTNGLAYHNWTYIKWYFNAPSSTAFIDYNGTKYSLKSAANAGLINSSVYEQRNGQWYYYPDITTVFFGAGNTYAIYSNVQGSNVTIFVPGDRYRADRSRQDIMKAGNRDPRFRNVRTETYGENLSWDPNFELRYMSLDYVNSRGVAGTTNLYQATKKTSPLERYTSFVDPDTGQQQSWVQVNPNTLD
jgi:Peptidase family M23